VLATKSHGFEHEFLQKEVERIVSRLPEWEGLDLLELICTMVCGPYVVTLLNWTPKFEWHMARFVVGNGR
jgi:hypothetical protein